MDTSYKSRIEVRAMSKGRKLPLELFFGTNNDKTAKEAQKSVQSLIAGIPGSGKTQYVVSNYDYKNTLVLVPYGSLKSELQERFRHAKVITFEELRYVDIDSFETIVVDEYHVLKLSKFRNLDDVINKLRNSNKRMIFISATPDDFFEFDEFKLLDSTWKPEIEIVVADGMPDEFDVVLANDKQILYQLSDRYGFEVVTRETREFDTTKPFGTTEFVTVGLNWKAHKDEITVVGFARTIEASQLFQLGFRFRGAKKIRFWIIEWSKRPLLTYGKVDTSLQHIVDKITQWCELYGLNYKVVKKTHCSKFNVFYNTVPGKLIDKIVEYAGRLCPEFVNEMSWRDFSLMCQVIRLIGYRDGPTIKFLAEHKIAGIVEIDIKEYITLFLWFNGYKNLARRFAYKLKLDYTYFRHGKLYTYIKRVIANHKKSAIKVAPSYTVGAQPYVKFGLDDKVVQSLVVRPAVMRYIKRALMERSTRWLKTWKAKKIRQEIPRAINVSRYVVRQVVEYLDLSMIAHCFEWLFSYP